MTQVVDLRAIPPRDRADAVLAMASTIVPVEFEFPGDAPVVHGTVTDLGPLRITSILSNARRVERTLRLSRDDTLPSLMLGLQRKGSSLLVQDGREVVVRPGDLVVYSSTSPYTLVDVDGYSQHQLRMPLSDVALPSR